MASDQQCTEAYEVLCTTYHRRPTDEGRKAFRLHLAAVPGELVSRAVLDACAESPHYPPSASAVRAMARKLQREEPDPCEGPRKVHACDPVDRNRGKLPASNAYERVARLWERYPPGCNIPPEHCDVAERVYRCAGLDKSWHSRRDKMLAALGATADSDHDA